MKLNEFFSSNNKYAVAYSGGVDSSFLLYAAITSGAKVQAYYVKSSFQPEFEYEDAMRTAEHLGITDRLTVMEADVLKQPDITANTSERCYFCKKLIMGIISEQAKADGCNVILEGTNASDDIADRPGFKALEEAGIRSPLREAGFTKEMIRQLSKNAGLPTWDKHSYSCLATRIPHGTAIETETLERIEKAEWYLFEQGFKDFRVRFDNGAAKLQINKDDYGLYLLKESEVMSRLKDFFSEAYLDEHRR